MHCKDCKYYTTYERQFLRGGVLGVDIIGTCTNPKITDDGHNKDGLCPDDGIYATCDEGRGDLEVGKLFGCIHFESNLNKWARYDKAVDV